MEDTSKNELHRILFKAISILRQNVDFRSNSWCDWVLKSNIATSDEELRRLHSIFLFMVPKFFFLVINSVFKSSKPSCIFVIKTLICHCYGIFVKPWDSLVLILKHQFATHYIWHWCRLLKVGCSTWNSIGCSFSSKHTILATCSTIAQISHY